MAMVFFGGVLVCEESFRDQTSWSTRVRLLLLVAGVVVVVAVVVRACIHEYVYSFFLLHKYYHTF